MDLVKFREVKCTWLEIQGFICHSEQATEYYSNDKKVNVIACRNFWYTSTKFRLFGNLDGKEVSLKV